MRQLLARVLGRGGSDLPGVQRRGAADRPAVPAWGGGRAASKDIARERLKRMLAHDRVDMEPELMEALKEELLRTVSRYLEVDRAGMEVGLQRQAAAVALVASIPVRAVRRPAASGEGQA